MRVLFREHRVILWSALWMSIAYNSNFFKHILKTYPLSGGAGSAGLSLHNILFLGVAFIVLFCALCIALRLLCNRWSYRVVLPFLMVIGAVSAYYMDTYDVIIDKTMLLNAAQTNTKEIKDLLSLKFFGYVIGLGVLPAIIAFKAKWPSACRLPVSINHQSKWAKFHTKTCPITFVFICLLGAVLVMLPFSKTFASFFREHKIVRMYTNPITPLYSAVRFATGKLKSSKQVVALPIATDAVLNHQDKRRELVVLVVGETARADHFSLNGYPKKTNPLLEKRDVVSFPNMSSCGTSTAVSVPCMFSSFGRKEYSESKFENAENILDVLQKTGVNVLWRDNNSDSKGVATRLAYQDFQKNDTNTICDIECRDEGMLVGLQAFIDSHPEGDILIVLHQMGSHGPAYFKRYPKAFAQFKPECEDNDLEKCTLEAINNTYDNTILYTDHFLNETIKLLENNQQSFEAGMLYMSDHGESLGENGLYLHGMPYSIAPKAQTNPAMVMWLAPSFGHGDNQKLRAIQNQEISHDMLFHTLMGFFELESASYKSELDILHLASQKK